MKYYLLCFLMISVPAFGKGKSLLIGPSIWISPEIGYDSIRAPGKEKVSGVEEEYKTTMGISAEFVAPQPDGNFFSMGLDVFLKSKNKQNPDVKIAPIALFTNFGIMDPYCVNLHVRMFAGIGAMFLNYKSLSTVSEYGDSLGLSYQFGAGIITPKFFIDILMRGGSGSLEREFGVVKKAESDYSFTSAMLKAGLAF